MHVDRQSHRQRQELVLPHQEQYHHQVTGQHRQQHDQQFIGHGHHYQVTIPYHRQLLLLVVLLA
jgi:hypothetical protein